MTNVITTKKALLSSAVALLLCFAMLMGTTFAWFTDSAASGSNVITAGNLDIVVEYTLDGETWKTLDGANDLFQKGLWEPGHTEVVALRIKNNGTLALKYAANMNIVNENVGKTKDGADIVLSDILTVNSIIMDTGAMGDVLLGVAFSDESTLQYENTASFKKANVLGSDEMLLAGASKYLIVKVDMAETVGNEANHNGTNIPSINFGINVLATQFTYENDSFGKDYDEDAEYPVVDAAGLKEALASGVENIALSADITVNKNETVTVASGVNATINLNGHTLSTSADKSGNQEMFLVKGNLTVENGKLQMTAQNNQEWNAMAAIFDVTAGGVLTMKNVEASVSGTDMNFIVHLNNWGSATLTVENCDFTASYCGVRAFNSGYDMNTVTIKNTDFHGGRMFWVHNYTSEGKDDSTLTLDIYNNGNTSDNAKPVRFGFSNSVYYDLDGNVIS